MRCGLQRGADTCEHGVKSGQRTDLDITDVLGNLLDDTEHGAFTDGTVAALENVVVGDSLDRGLKQRELVAHERVRSHEMGLVSEVPIGFRAVGEVEQGLEIRRLLCVDGFERRSALVVLLQQAFADDLLHVRGCELDPGLEPGLNFREVIALPLGTVSDDLVHVLLRGHEHPSTPTALRVQRLGDRLKVQHQVRVGADELPDLVDEEVQPKTCWLLVQPGTDLVGEVLDRHRVVVLIRLKDAARDVQTRDPCIRLIDLLPDRGESEAGAALEPLPARHRSERFLEGVELTFVVELTLEPCDVPLVAVVSAGLVEDLHEHPQQGIGLVFADQGGLLVDVEQQALRRDAVGLVEQRGQEGVGCLGAEALQDAGKVVALHSAEKVREHLQQVRLTGTEETRNPHAIRIGVVRVRLKQLLQSLGRLIGQDVFVHLDAQMAGIVGLDHALDGPLDILGENLGEAHDGHGSCSRMFLAR